MQSLRIITGSNVDLICPFPTSEVKRAFGWMHCYRTITESDDTPQGIDACCDLMTRQLPLCVSWGMIDKNHLTNINHEAPLVGFGMFEPYLQINGKVRDGRFHAATARRSWKARIVDEALDMVLKDLFEGLPDLLRVSASINERNSPMKALLKRGGFKCEGFLEDALLYGGAPQNLLLYGLTRRRWEAHQINPTPLAPEPEVSPSESETKE